MKAVILAAGPGSRLGALTENLPKCLLAVGGRPLLDQHLDALTAAGIQDITVVTGFRADQVGTHLAGRCRIVVNDRFASTNSIVSLQMAAPFIRGGAFLFQNADVLYAPELVRRFVLAGPSNACLIDPEQPYRPAEYKVELDQGRIVRYSRDVPPSRSVGQSAQLVKIGARDSAAFLDRTAEIIAAGGHLGFPNQAYEVLMAGEGLWPVYTAALPWWEVDTPEDYAAANDAFTPVSRDDPARGAPAVSRLATFVTHPRIPWRYRWLNTVARPVLRRPLRTARQVRAFREGRLTLEGLDLQANGPDMLALTLREAEDIGLHPFLLWGTLLGCVRDHGFIRNDQDLDLGVLESDQGRLPSFRDRMLAHGFRVRIENPFKLSLVHPSHPRLFIDVDVVHRHRDRWAITNADADPRFLFHYRFSPDVFSSTGPALLEGVPVLLPGDPEGFLSAVYGDWRTPASKSHYLYGPLNLEIEVRPESSAA